METNEKIRNIKEELNSANIIILIFLDISSTSFINNIFNTLLDFSLF